MPLPKDMPTRDPERAEGDDQTTEYRSSQGGWYPPEEKPVPGTPKG